MTAQNKEARVQRSPKHAIMVLGMHRSGTSALAGTLARLGAAPPRTLMSADQNNTRGYWESRPLMKLHDQILSSAGTRWDDWGRFNPSWLASPVAADFAERLSAAIREEYGNSHFILVKDPRICRFFPLWKQVLDEEGIKPKVIIPVRNPLDVASSLHSRDNLGINRALLLWLRHVLEAEYTTRGLDRAFTTYEGLVTDWKAEVTRLGGCLGVSWPKLSPSTELDVGEFLSGDLRHHDSPVPQASSEDELRGWVSSAYQSLLKFVSGPEDEGEMRKLDGIKGEFDRTSSIYGILLKEQEQIAGRVNAELSTRVSREADRAAKLEASVGQHAQRIGEITTELQHARSELALLTEQRGALEAEIAGLRLALAEAEGSLKTQSAALRDAEVARASAETQLQLVRKQVNDRFKEVAHLTRLYLEAKDAERRLQTANDEADAKLVAIANEHAQARGLLLEEAQVLEARLELLRRSNELYAGELTRLENRLAQIQASMGWRILAPVRNARAWARGQAHPEEVGSSFRLLRESDWFDAEWYAQQCKDVSDVGVPPEAHYLVVGAAEGRNPSPEFDTRYYLQNYPDVAISGLNPLLHFIQHGQAEGRLPKPSN